MLAANTLFHPGPHFHLLSRFSIRPFHEPARCSQSRLGIGSSPPRELSIPKRKCLIRCIRTIECLHEEQRKKETLPPSTRARVRWLTEPLVLKWPSNSSLVVVSLTVDRFSRFYRNHKTFIALHLYVFVHIHTHRVSHNRSNIFHKRITFWKSDQSTRVY